MANHRLPAMKAGVSGAALKNPQRHKGRRVSQSRPLGQPYVKMTEAQKDAWREFADELPWLNSSHRPLLQLACILRVRMDADDVGVNQIQAYSAILSKLGATPVDETKVNHGGEEDEDPTDAFFTRPN